MFLSLAFFLDWTEVSSKHLRKLVSNDFKFPVTFNQLGLYYVCYIPAVIRQTWSFEQNGMHLIPYWQLQHKRQLLQRRTTFTTVLFTAASSVSTPCMRQSKHSETLQQHKRADDQTDRESQKGYQFAEVNWRSQNGSVRRIVKSKVEHRMQQPTGWRRRQEIIHNWLVHTVYNSWHPPGCLPCRAVPCGCVLIGENAVVQQRPLLNTKHLGE